MPYGYMSIALHGVAGDAGSQPITNTGLRAAKAVARDRGVSDVTLWRWRTRGWIKTVNICGKKYVDLQSLADFDRRAAQGEFAKAPAGAAGKSAEARAARVGQMETANTVEVA
jgi:hypothetical protein